MRTSKTFVAHFGIPEPNDLHAKELEEPNGPVKIGMTTGQSKTGRAGGAPGLPLE